MAVGEPTDAVEYLDRKANEWKALGQELTEDDADLMRLFYTAVEAALREVALALQRERVGDA